MKPPVKRDVQNKTEVYLGIGFSPQDTEQLPRIEIPFNCSIFSFPLAEYTGWLSYKSPQWDLSAMQNCVFFCDMNLVICSQYVIGLVYRKILKYSQYLTAPEQIHQAKIPHKYLKMPNKTFLVFAGLITQDIHLFTKICQMGSVNLTYNFMHSHLKLSQG